MEEIDIIELLKRVKEGKAPKEIEVDGKKLIYHQDEQYFERLYQTETNSWWCNSSFITLDTKIKILDKPIIEELDEIELKSFNDEAYMKLIIRNNRDKINEIIKFINNKE